MEVQAFIISLLLLAIVSQTETRSLDTSVKCAAECTESRSLEFLEGFTYHYQYEANVTSSFFEPTFEEEQNGDPKILIHASTKIAVVSPCELVLQITDATIIDPTRDINAQDWTLRLQKNPLHFSWQDGRIPDVCASGDDPNWVVNLKRGILSMFVHSPEVTNPQMTFQTATEMGVVGECEWSYSTTSGSEGTQITKTIDYSKCEGRDQRLLISHFTPYYSDSNQQSFIHSEQECEIVINNGRFISSQCMDSHTFSPFSSSQSRAKSTVTQKLLATGRVQSYRVDTVSSNDARRTTIVFENEEDDSTPSADISELQDLVNRICSTMRTEDYKMVGYQFTRMVFLLRRVDAAALGQVYSMLDGACPMFEQELKGMFQDALQWCGSEGCVVYATQLIEAGTLPDATASRWLSGMSLITEPTMPMLRAMLGVVRSGRYMDQAYLATGTMIHRLTTGKRDRGSEPDVVIALEEFHSKLGVNCRTANADAKQTILLALRAIGNAGQTTSPNILAACASESSNDMEIRIAAMQAFRRMPCSVDRSGITQLYLDHNEDSELRITSYLAMMSCPTPQQIKTLMTFIDQEPNKQFASFVWTHMQQLLESTDPLKGYIKPYLIEADFMKPVDLDPRKYSRYYEASLFSDAMNAGATVESSLVWSPKSFVPRSANLNLTLDVFGQAVNLFEVGGRVEGVEAALQSFLGPKGFLKNNRLSDLLRPTGDDEADDDDDEPEETETRPRTPRSSSDARLREIKQQHEGRVPREDSPSASVFLRVFGNEMYYKNTRDMAPFTAEAGAVDVTPILARLAEGTSYKYHDDMMLMNSAHVIPTAAGLPLTLAFNGTASIDVSAEGRLDMQGLFNSKPSVDVLGSINPRAVVLITGSMTVDAHVTRVGIATESSAVTSWTVGGKVSLERGQRLQVKIDAPYERNTVFRFNHELLNVVDDLVLARQVANDILLDSSANDCSQEYAGQRLCISNSMTRHPENEQDSYVFPKYGPATFEMYILKEDTGFDSYILEATYDTMYSETSDIPVTLHTNLVLDTPGSSVNRRTNVHMHYNLDPMTFMATMEKPGDVRKQVSGSYEHLPNRKSLSLRYINNGQSSIFTAAFEKQQDRTEKQWSISSTLTTPDKVITGSAVMVLDPAGTMKMNMSVINLMESPVVLNFGLQDRSVNNRNRFNYRGYGKVQIPRLVDTGVRFDINIKPKTDVFTLDFNYEFSGSEEQRILFSHKRRNHSTSAVTSWEVEQKFTCTQYPDINHYVQFSHVNGDEEVSSFVKLGFGRHAGHVDSRMYFLINQTFGYSQLENGQSQIAGSAQIKLPPMKFSHQASFSHACDSTSFITRVTVDSHHGSLQYQDNSAASGLLDSQIGVELPTPWGHIRFSDRVRETQENMYHMNVDLGLGNTGDLNMRGDVYVDNLAERKRIEITFDDDDDKVLLHARTMFVFLRPAGFTFQNTIESKFNDLINVTIRHEGAKEGGFETNVLVKHDPQLYAELMVDFENSPESADRLVRVDFKNDLHHPVRFVEVSANKNVQRSRSVSKYTGQIGMRTNLPALSIQSVQATGQMAMRGSLNTVSASANVNDEEILAASGSHQYEISAGGFTGTTSTTLAAHQRLRENIPSSANLSVTIENTESDSRQLNIRYQQDDADKLIQTLQITNDPLRITGQTTQFFNANCPEQMSLEVSRVARGINVQISADEQIATLEVVRATDSSVTGTLSHNSQKLSEKRVPRNVAATLQWGQRESDRKTGLWLTSTVDRYQSFNAEAMHGSSDNGARVGVAVTHNVRSWMQFVPQISTTATYSLVNSEFEAEFRHEVDSEVKLAARVDRDSESVVFTSSQKCSCLISKGVPQAIDFSLRGRSGAGDLFGQITTRVDDVHSVVSFSSNDELLRAIYKSNCSVMGGDFKFEIEKPTTDGTVVVKYVRDGVERQASITVNVNLNENSLDMQWSQNIYENTNLPLIPRSGSMSARYAPTADGFTVTYQEMYNEYSVEFETEYSLVTKRKRGSIGLKASLSQNVFEIIPSFNVRGDLSTNYQTYATGVVSYVIAEETQRTIRLKFGYDEDDEDTTLTEDYELLARLQHNEPRLPTPTDVKVVATLSPLFNNGQLTVTSTTDEATRRIATGYAFDAESNRVTVTFGHNLPMLSEVGVYRTVTAEASLLLPSVEGSYSATLGGSLQLDEDRYSLSGSGTLTFVDAGVVIASDLSQDIMPLYQFGVPRHVRTRTTITYDVVDKSTMTSSIDISSNVIRTMYDPETDEETEIENSVSSTINVQLFNWHATFAGNHDFNTPGLPRNVRYEISASGSANSHGPVFYKSATMCVTLDGVKQSVTVTINRNKADRSLYVGSTHNITRVLQYGIPGNMSVSFRKRDNYDADLSIVYDTAKKSIGFKLDYNGQQNKLIAYFSHSFDMLVNALGIPKNMGFDTRYSLGRETLSSNIRYVWGETIAVADLTTRWHLAWELPSLLVKLNQNVTSNDVFPIRTTVDVSTSYSNNEVMWRVDGTRGSVSGSCRKMLEEGRPAEISCRVQQSFDVESLPANAQVTATLSDVEPGKRLEVTVECNRDDKLHLQVDGNINKDAWTGEVRVQSTQAFVESDVFPVEMTLLTNASISTGVTAFVRLERDNLPPFQVETDVGVDLEAMSGHLELNHLQREWKPLPKKLKIDASYRSFAAANERQIRVTIKQGRKRNLITVGNNYNLDGNTLYGRVSYTHDFADLQEIVPMHGSANLLLEKALTSATAQFNVTMYEVSLTHSIRAGYVKELESLSTIFQATQDNLYLAPYIEHTVGLRTLTQWGNNVLANLQLTYGDDLAEVEIESDRETTAFFSVEQSWDYKPNQMSVTVSGSQEEGSATMQVTIDGQRQDVSLSGQLQNGAGNVRLTHGFEDIPIPGELSLSGSYRFSPDIYMSANAGVDGQQYSVSGGFEQLDDGFRVSTTLLDDISRTATFRRTVLPGSLSVELDHNIAELSSFLPMSVGLSGSAGLSPRPNVTLSLRQHQTTQRFTAEADVKQLQFTFRHDFVNLPIPRTFGLHLSGSMQPLSGSFSLNMDDTSRHATATIDPDNLVATLIHNLPKVPLPKSLRIDASGSTSPLSGRVRVVVNGVDKLIGGELDLERMRARIYHTAQELDAFFVPRDIAVGGSMSAEPLAGELFLSVDGLVRSIGGSIDQTRGLASVFQSAKELQYLPRNITLQVSGSMEPLHGSISLTMDEVERQVSAGVVPARSLSLSHGIPELDAYIPRQLAVDLDLAPQSVKGSVSFTKDEARKTASFEVLTSLNNVRITAEQDIVSGKNIPSTIEVDLSGSLDYKNASIYVKLDSSFISLNGNLFTGENADGWYGFNVEAQQTFRALRKSLGIVKNGQLMLKGRKAGTTWETAVIIDLIKGHGYQAAASVDPVLAESSFTLHADYTHSYKDLTRTVAGTLTGEKSTDGSYSLSVEGTQSSPDRVRVALGGSSNMAFGKQSRGSLTFHAAQNIPQLIEAGVPRTIQDGTLNFRVQPLSGSTSLNFNADGDSNRHELNWNVEWTGPHKSIRLVRVDGDTSSTVLLETTSDSEQATVGARFQMESTNLRNQESLSSQEVTGKVYYGLTNPVVTLDVNQPRLNNLGVPLHSEVSLTREESDHHMTWKFNINMDDESVNSGFSWLYRQTPYHLEGMVFFDHNSTQLEMIYVPKHVTPRFTIDVQDSMQNYVIRFGSAVEVDSYIVSSNFTQTLQSTRGGSVSRAMRHNVPQLEDLLKWRSIEDTYSWSTENSIYSLHGIQLVDDVLRGNYSLTYNTVSGDIDYNENSSQGEYQGKYRLVKTAETFSLLAKVTGNDTNLFLVKVDTTPQPTVEAQFVWKVWGPEIESQFSYSRDESGCRLSVTNEVTVEEVAYTTTISDQPYSKDGKKGYSLSVRHQAGEGESLEVDVKSLSGVASGSLTFFMMNNRIIPDFARRTQLEINWEANSVRFYLLSGRKRFEADSSYSVLNEVLDMNANLQQNIVQLSDLGVPHDSHMDVTISTSRVSADVTMDEIIVFHLSAEVPSINLVVKNIEETILLSFAGQYQLDPYKSIEARLISAPLQIDYQLESSLKLFEQGSGNFSFSFGLEDVTANQGFDINVYAHPTTVKATDFYAGMMAFSDMELHPFSLSMACNSSSDIAQNIYRHEVNARLNDKTVSAVGSYSPANFRLAIRQTWTELMSNIVVSGTNTTSNGRQLKSLKLQWGEEEDSLEVATNCMYNGLEQDHSVTVTQPSSLLTFANLNVAGSVDFRTAETYKYQFNFTVDDVVTDVKVQYTGNLPQPFGHHELVVDVTQPITSFMPAQFKTRGIMTISAVGLYDSDWRITTQGDEIVVLSKAFRPTANGYSANFLWKQAYYDLPLRYISIRSEGEASDNSASGMGSLQIGNMPLMSSNFRTSIDQSEDRANRSLELSIQSGPLAKWVHFRTFGISTWVKEESSGRRLVPEYSVTVNLDGHVYHNAGDYLVKSSDTDLRFSGDFTLNHPLDLDFFGMPVPKSNTGNMKLAVRPKGVRLLVEYDNELMENRLRLNNQYRINNGDRLLEGNSFVKFGPEDAANDVTLGIRVAKNDEDFDYISTITLRYPDANIDSSLILSGLDSAQSLATEGVFKNYDGVERKLWKLGTSYDKSTHVIELTVNTPDMEETTVRGDFSQVVRQTGQLIQQLSADAVNTRLRFVKGMDATSDGYDLFMGYELDGDATYTVHLKAGGGDSMKYVQLETKRDFVTDKRIARVAVDLVNPRLIQLRLKALPALSTFMRNMFTTCDSEIGAKIDVLADDLVSFLESCKSILTGSSNVETDTNQFLDGLIAKVNNMRLSSTEYTSRMFLGSSDKFDNMQQMIEHKVRESILFLMNLVTKAQDKVSKPFTDFVDEHYSAVLAQAGNTLKRKLRPVEDLMSMINAHELFLDIVDEAIQKSVAFVMTNGEAFVIACRRPMSELLIVTDSDIVINIPLEFELDHFVPLPTLDEVKTWLVQTALAVQIDNAVKSMYSYADKYYLLRSIVYMPKDELLPPFKGHAFVSGFRHFSTFDKKHFDFSSSCQTTHVLVTDMRNGNFTVTMSAGDRVNDIPASIEVIVENRRVAIFSDFTVQLNGRTRSLPLVADKISASLQGNVVHVRHIDGDLDVACDFDVELCTIDVSPFYFGATGGLAGLYNDEPSDDMLNPALELVPDVAERAASWETSDTLCATGNEYSPCNAEASAMCTSLFTSTSSPFRACFSLVDPEPFMKMCKDDMCSSTDASKTCSASAAYAYRCRLAGAPLVKPDHCTVCKDMSGRSFDASQTRSADITGVDLVFVIQESTCMSRTGKSIRKLVKRLTNELRDESLRDNRYYIVGYGGADGTEAPHTYTINGKSFTARKKSIYKTIRQMELVSSNANADGMAAVAYASQLPFRAGAKPVIVLVSCDECVSESAVSYNDVEYQLRRQGIVLHHIPHHQIGAGGKSKTMYGFDGRNAFSKQDDVDSSVIKGSKSDSCVPLATVTGGSVWDARLLSDPKFQKKLANYIATHASARQSVTCQCTANAAGIATSLCA